MIFLLVCAVALLALVGFVFWRNWVSPWRDARELVEAIAADRPPRTFLITGNEHAHRFGLVLEKLWQEKQEQSEQEHERASRVEAILAALPDGFVFLDGKGRIRLTNPAFNRLFDLARVETGRPLLETVRDIALDRIVTETLADGKPRQLPLQVPHAQGNLEIEATVASLSNQSKRLEGAIVLFRDNTRVHRVEEMRRDFVANVSHELRTPLSIFRGYLETLLETPEQPPQELLRILEVMEKHSNRLNSLVEDVLSLAQLEQPAARLDLTEIYLPDFLAAILRDWEKRFESKLLRSSLEAPVDLPIILADEHRLQEIIYNLLDNALKYSQPEGTVNVKVARATDHVLISVSDRGVGIPARDLPRIFERFYRADKARSREAGGTGLGLSIVKHIAELHGGGVAAESAPDRGTTISVSLPIQPAVAASVTET